MREVDLSPEMQQFPQLMRFRFIDDASNPDWRITTLYLAEARPNHFANGPVELDSGKYQGYLVPGILGSRLTNNSVIDDGYRFHDALHIAIMTKLKWSPVMRALLGVKRRSDQRVDNIDDGGRAINF